MEKLYFEMLKWKEANNFQNLDIIFYRFPTNRYAIEEKNN